MSESMGYNYIDENCRRAITHLVSGSGPEWRERINEALCFIYRAGAQVASANWMSTETRTNWEACHLGRKIDDMKDSDVAELAQNLADYLFSCQRDLALYEAELARQAGAK